MSLTRPQKAHFLRSTILLMMIFGLVAVIAAQENNLYSLPEAQPGVEYLFRIPLAGGKQPLKWELVEGKLPPGIDLGQSSGMLFGVPLQTAQQSYQFTVRVTDSSKPAITESFQFEIAMQSGGLRLLLTPKSGSVARRTNRARRPATDPSSTTPVTAEGGEDTAGNARQARTADAQAATGTATNPRLDSPLIEGDLKVAGYAPSSEGDRIVLSVLSSSGEPLYQDEKPLRNAGRFTFDLAEHPLVKDQKVKAEIFNGSETTALGGSEVTVGQATVVNTDLKGNVQTIEGTTDPSAGAVTVRVLSGTTVIQRKTVPVDPVTGAFNVALTRPLAATQVVRVDRLRESITVATAETPLEKPIVRSPLLEGTRTVRGFAKGATEVDVQVLDSENQVVQRKRTKNVTSETGDFSASLDDPLVAGQSVVAQPPGGSYSDSRTVEAPGDWGRARAYFAIGMMLSKERTDFSKRDLYLNFNLDWNWFNSVRYPENRLQPGTQQLALGKQERNDWEIRFNTFFDARFTPFPVNGSETAANGLGSDAFGNFLTSQKGALMQVGWYAPIFHNGVTTWRYQGSRNAIFIAPLARGGVQTLFNKDALVDDRFKDNDLFTFLAGGVRLGHYKLTDSDDRAPELISYLDIMRGRWQNLERLVPSGQFDPAGKQILVRIRPLRWAFEGRLKVPNLPFQIGFDANIGEGPDDLRFIFGTNFDLGELFGKIR